MSTVQHLGVWERLLKARSLRPTWQVYSYTSNQPNKRVWANQQEAKDKWWQGILKSVHDKRVRAVLVSYVGSKKGCRSGRRQLIGHCFEQFRKLVRNAKVQLNVKDFDQRMDRHSLMGPWVYIYWCCVDKKGEGVGEEEEKSASCKGEATRGVRMLTKGHRHLSGEEPSTMNTKLS